MISIGDLVKDIISEQKFIIEQLEHYITGGGHYNVMTFSEKQNTPAVRGRRGRRSRGGAQQAPAGIRSMLEAQGVAFADAGRQLACPEIPRFVALHQDRALNLHVVVHGI
jgi:hypothetical protein